MTPMNEQQHKELSQCRDIALAHLEQMETIINKMVPIPYALSQQVSVAIHKVKRIELEVVSATEQASPDQE